ncbi:hypothetical protein QBC40DRAFT_275893 [Triangularia verruculosa]|uniref:Uncharacterized protein n=1 Tax=Triangularia verruculosa TaxID=2587418 RepID=A0AAN7AZ88_9PEZI|nr:hypothetical protein QBC40DRAFT_275893 [Triangularia verruculosa]
MPDYKDILKKGWHPEKSGTSIKGSVKSLVGRGGDDKNKYEHHTARPLSSLKDPASFAPPPKRTNTGSLSNISPTLPQQQQQQGVADQPPKPPKPWSLNTTGLSTASLPPPPARRDVPSRPSSISSADGVRAAPPPVPPARSSSQNPLPRPPPALPPRLPPRSPPVPGGNALASLVQQVSSASLDAPAPPPPNQSSINRLSAAGISVPGLGIGSPSTQPPPQPPRTSSPAARQPPQLPSGLSSHLAKAATTSFSQHQSQSQQNGTTATGTESSSGYASLAKAGFNRYQSATPSQKAAVHSAAKEGYTRYQSATPEQKAAVQGAASSVFSAAVAAKKKKPPPPPPPPAKRKPQFLSSSRVTQDDDGPPPVPVGTRPVF